MKEGERSRINQSCGMTTRDVSRHTQRTQFVYFHVFILRVRFLSLFDIYIYIYIYIYILFIYYLFIHSFIHSSIHLIIHLIIYLFIQLFNYLFIYSII
jgi:hypothetical protein